MRGVGEEKDTLNGLIKLTTGEVRVLVQPFIRDNPEYSYQNSIEVTEKAAWEPTQTVGMLQKRKIADSKNQTCRCRCKQKII